MKLFLSALCLCASGLLIYISFKIIYAYTMIDRFHSKTLKIADKLQETNEDINNIQNILDKYEKPIDLCYKVFNKINSFFGK